MSARRGKLYVVNQSSSSSEGEDPPEAPVKVYKRPSKSPAYGPRTKPGSALVGLPPPLPPVPSPASLMTTNLGPSSSSVALPSLSSPSSTTADDEPPPPTPDLPIPRSSPIHIRPQPKPPVPKVNVLVTTDAERYTRVDIPSTHDPAAIREAIFSKLLISDEAHYAIFQTDFGQMGIGDPLSNERLAELCREEGDQKGSLLFYVVPHNSFHSTRELPRRPAVSPSPSSPRSRTGSVSSTSENAPGYDADLDDERRTTMRPAPMPLSVSVPSARGSSPPLSSSSSTKAHRPMSPFSPPQSPAAAPTITDRSGKVYAVPPPPPPLSPKRATFNDGNETTPTTSFHTPASAVVPPDTPLSALPSENSVHHSRRHPAPLGKVQSPSKPRRKLPNLDNKDLDSSYPLSPDSPMSSARLQRVPASPSSARVKSAFPRPTPPTPRTYMASGPSGSSSRGGQPVSTAHWAVPWKYESKPSSPSTTTAPYRTLSKGKSTPDLKSALPASTSSKRNQNLVARPPTQSKDTPPPPPTPPVRRFGEASTSRPLISRPLPVQGPVGSSADIRPLPLSNGHRPSLVASPTVADPYPRPSSSLDNAATLISPSRTHVRPSPLLSPSYDHSDSRSPRGVSPIRAFIDRSVLSSSRSVPPAENSEPRSSVESPSFNPPSPRGIRSPRTDRLFSDTGLLDFSSSRSPVEPTLRPGDPAITDFMHFVNANGSSTALSASTEATYIGAESDEESDGDDDLWNRKPDLVIETSPSGSNTAVSPPSATSSTVQEASQASPSPPSPSKPNRRNVTSNGSTFQNQSETTWAPRPAPEDVFEQLEKFFPNHDIDEPVFEADSGAGSPVNGDIPAPLPTVAPLVPNKAKKNNLANKKSLRMAAGEQYNKKRISHEPRRVSRRMTRLWGSKLEEVTTKDSRVSLSTTPESPGSSGGASTFKWVRGELIGRGTYGRVYLALNATTGEMIAVKQVEIPQTASDMYDTRQSTVVQALKSESETLKDLDHPNIVQYLGFEETPANLSIFLEYVPGGSIGSCLLRHGKFDEPVTKHFTSQILDGLHYLHSKNILHRDLKADNILVEHGGVCKISDFGISKRMTDDLSGGAQTAMQGTVFWMAPEVISTAEKGYNSKVDIWSVGCVVLEMWAGSRPWSGSEMMAVMFKLYHEKKPPPIPENVTLTELADDFRKLCFAINPDDRPPASVLRKHPYLELPPHWQFTGKFGSRNS